MDKRDPLPTVGSDMAEKEWLRSWHKGEVYVTQSEYNFAGDMEVDVTEEANWLQRWSTKQVSTVEKGGFYGKAIVKTFVYHEAPQLRLSRDYQYVNSMGTWGAHATPKSEMVQKAVGKAVEGDYLGRKNRRLFYQGVKFFNPLLGEILADWGDAGFEMSEDWLKENVGSFDKEGRLSIPETSVIAKAMDITERRNVIAQATAFSENVNGRKIAVAQDGKYTRSMREIKSLASAEVDPAESVEAFDSYLAQGAKASKELESLVKRESFSVTAELFDANVRKPSDLWTVDASFFDSFLHPDLKGAFHGTAVVKYVADEEGDEAYISRPSGVKEGQKARWYDVRKLIVVPSGKVDNSTVSTDFSYDERPMGGRFWAKYDAGRSNITILVDKKSGHVVFSEMYLKGSDVGALPSLKLLQGYKSAGEGSLKLTFKGDVFSAKELAGEIGK